MKNAVTITQYLAESARDAADTVKLAGSAQNAVRELSDDQRKDLYWASEDERVAYALAIENQMKCAKAIRQLYILNVFQAINNQFQHRPWMGNFAERLRENLIERITAYGVDAHPLSDKQFEAAIRSAW